MTFLNTRYRLAGPLAAREYSRLNSLMSVYGIRGVDIQGDDLVVEYDASRVHEAEVLAAVRGTGIAVLPPRAIPAGGFDYTGEFKDYSWPVRGLSPANQRN